MAMLTYAVDLHKAQQAAAPNASIAAKITKLDELLDELVT